MPTLPALTTRHVLCLRVGQFQIELVDDLGAHAHPFFPTSRADVGQYLLAERVREIRRQRDGRDWEVVMQPPVNRVLSVSRARLPGLLRQFGETA